VRASREWKRVEQIVEVPQEGHGLALGVMCHGLGEVWADDLQLDIVDHDVPLTSFGVAVTGDLDSQQGQPSEETKKRVMALQTYPTVPDSPGPLLAYVERFGGARPIRHAARARQSLAWREPSVFGGNP
jgi:hypothetical protein